MAGMVGSAIVQEVVSGASSFRRNNHEERASQSHLIERLQYAHLELKFALERTKRMPVIEVSLLQRRMILKHAFEESRDLLCKLRTTRVNLEGQGAEQGVTLCPSLPNRIMHVLKPFFGTEKGSISEICVRRFEFFAEKTNNFCKDIESGFSLALYRFSCPLVRQLLEGKWVHYGLESGSQYRGLFLYPYFLEDYRAVAFLTFGFKDNKTPMKCFDLQLSLRLSESTDIVGICTQCLQSLEPLLKPVADFASGELAEISTQVGFLETGPARLEAVFNVETDVSGSYHQETLCCIGDQHQPSAKKILSPELTEMFPEQVNYFRFHCFISATDYNLKSSTVVTNRNTIKPWPILSLSVAFRPHLSWKTEVDKVCTYFVTSQGQLCGRLYCVDLSMMAKFVALLAVARFEPEQMEYRWFWCAPHGGAMFIVSKPASEMGCAPKIGGGSKTRRASKRKR